MKRLNEIRARLAELKESLAALGEQDELSEEDETRFAAELTEWDALTEEAKPLEVRETKLEEVRTAAVVETNRENGDGNKNVNIVTRKDENIYDLSELRFAPAAERQEILAERAERAIEAFPRSVKPEWRESVQRLVREGGGGIGSATGTQIAEHVLKYGSPVYERAWKKAMQNPTGMTLNDEERAALAEGTSTTGGFMVPVFIDPSIILTNDGTANPFRSIATVKSITTQTWKGITSAGVSAEWVAEATEMTDASPTVAQPTITPVRADAYVTASFEMLEDTDVASEFGGLFADARDRHEGAAFAVGTGSTQPTGIVTRLQATTASRVTSNTNAVYGPVDVYALDNAMAPRFRPGASWLANKSIYNLTRQFATGSGPQHAFWADFGDGRPPSLIGYPAYESSSMFNAPLSTATASNDDILVLGDFSEYYIVDRIGMFSVNVPVVLGANRRPTGESGFGVFWRVGGDSPNPAAFRLLRV